MNKVTWNTNSILIVECISKISNIVNTIKSINRKIMKKNHLRVAIKQKFVHRVYCIL